MGARSSEEQKDAQIETAILKEKKTRCVVNIAMKTTGWCEVKASQSALKSCMTHIFKM